ncbi:tetratricopeptide repeat protein [Pseudoalteromonas fenneropenaei]|uniref:Tetratricopeptide repeat protein n=1 Tax=Pseudoalteromonas fenneropenaei TaxID=1737459 RepID=A0ABV7CI95_9GAMM
MWIPLLMALSLSPDALYKTMNDLKQQMQQNPAAALQTYQAIATDLPHSASQGVLELHRLGMQAAIINNDYVTLSQIAVILQQPEWFSVVKPELAIFISNFGIFYRRQGQYTLAEQTYQCAERYVMDAQQQLRIANNLAVLYRTQGKFNEAKQVLLKAKSKAATPDVEASIGNNLANLMVENGEYQAAADGYRSVFNYHVREDDHHNASRVGLNMLNALILAHNWRDYGRFHESVANQIAVAGGTLFSQYFQWQQVIVRYLETNVAPDAATQAALVKTMPALSKEEIAASIQDYIQRLALPALTSAWQQIYQPIENITSEQAQFEQPSIALKWCEPS